jgi:hypothetical protein
MNGFLDRINALFDAQPLIPFGLTAFVVALWFLKRKRDQPQDDPPV